jgi:hypothetical protein
MKGDSMIAPSTHTIKKNTLFTRFGIFMSCYPGGYAEENYSIYYSLLLYLFISDMCFVYSSWSKGLRVNFNYLANSNYIYRAERDGIHSKDCSENQPYSKQRQCRGTCGKHSGVPGA